MENFEGLEKLAETAEQTIERYKRTRTPAQSPLMAGLKGFGMNALTGVPIISDPIGAAILQYNQNALLKHTFMHPKDIKDVSRISRPVSPWLGLLIGGIHGYGIQKHTRNVYNELANAKLYKKNKRKKARH